MRVPDKIRRFEIGDEITPLHVGRMNEIIAAINSLLALRAGSGAELNRGDAGSVIEATVEDSTPAA
jgi:hypothetical protein